MIASTRNWLDDVFAAIAFAEVNEFETAREFLKTKRARKKKFSWDSVFTAISFAEEGEFETAKHFLRSSSRVLLLLEEDIPLTQELFHYIQGLIKPMNTAVEIFYIGEYIPDELKEFVKPLREEGLFYGVIQVKDKEVCDEAVVEYIKRHPDVDFYVIKPSKEVAQPHEERILKTLWQKMGVPFILIKQREFA
jgi:hypothetical protein